MSFHVIFRRVEKKVSNSSGIGFLQSLNAAHSEEFVGDPKRLRRWLREIEAQMEKSPNYAEATKMKHSELQKRLKDHTVSLFLRFFFVF